MRNLKGILLIFIIMLVWTGCHKMPEPPYGFLFGDYGDSIVLYPQKPLLVIMYDSIYEIDGVKRNITEAGFINDDTLPFMKRDSGKWVLYMRDSIRGAVYGVYIITEHDSFSGTVYVPQVARMKNVKDTLYENDTVYLSCLSDSFLRVKVFIRATDSAGNIYAYREFWLRDSTDYFVINPDSFEVYFAGSSDISYGLPRGIYNLSMDVKSFYKSYISGIEGILYGNITDYAFNIPFIVKKDSSCRVKREYR